MDLYCATFEKAEDGINVEFPDLPGCLTCGVDMEDAYEYAVEALDIWLSVVNPKVIPEKPASFEMVQAENPGKIVMFIPFLNY